MSLSNKEKVVQLLKSIETGATEPIGYINPNKYIQHNLAVGDGLEGFGAIMQLLPPGSARANTVRILADGDFVVAHTIYNFFGPKVGFDIFRFENEQIVEHWDNLQDLVEVTASGRTQTDGPTQIHDLDQTQENIALVKQLVATVFLGGQFHLITDFISPEKYEQHNPNVGDGLAALAQAVTSMAESGYTMIYEKNHIILGEGNFVIAVSEGVFLGKPSSFYDLFRIENGKIVEHWDTIETIPDESEWKNSNGKFGFPRNGET